MLKPGVVRYKWRKVRQYFRGDAAFASPKIYDYLEAEGFLYAIRLPMNQVLQKSIAHLLPRPLAVRRTMYGAITLASVTRLEAGTGSAGWWPR